MPEFKGPDLKSLGLPEMKMPEMPEIKMPEFKMPELPAIPKIGGGDDQNEECKQQ